MTLSSATPSRLFFWGFMILAQIGGFILFKDLADISQWWVQSDRDFTMSIWYNRWPLTIVTLLALAACILLWRRHRNLMGGLGLSALVALCLFNSYAGMLNTGFMFRPQQHEAMFVSVEEAPQFLQQMFHASYGDKPFTDVDEISVVVLETDEGAKAYTDYYMLQPHVIQGGLINGEEVIMTYCGLTNMGIAYSPVINGEPLELRAITQLRNNLVMADVNTGEPIQQMWGTLERDGEHGPAMQQWPTLRMPFGSFRELFPEGEVYVNGIEQQSDNPLIRLFDYVIRDGMMVHAVRGLQWQTEEPAFPTITEFDDRLSKKALVYGLNIGADHVAYTKEFVAGRGGLINVLIGGKSVVIYYDNALDSLVAYYNTSGDKVSEVDLMGNSDRGKLERVETLKSAIFWFIWYDFYRATDVNRI